jgi:DNA invertase Pin-like site-specific DNA recombinase
MEGRKERIKEGKKEARKEGREGGRRDINHFRKNMCTSHSGDIQNKRGGRM